MNVRLISVALAVLVLTVSACSSSTDRKAQQVCKKGTGANGFLTLCSGGASLTPCTLGKSYAELPNCTPPAIRTHVLIVPNVRGLSYVQAVRVLRAGHLRYAPHLPPSAGGRAVIQQTAKAGQYVPTNYVVGLAVASADCRFPDCKVTR
jgi:hypothetical protein